VYLESSVAYKIKKYYWAPCYGEVVMDCKNESDTIISLAICLDSQYIYRALTAYNLHQNQEQRTDQNEKFLISVEKGIERAFETITGVINKNKKLMIHNKEYFSFLSREIQRHKEEILVTLQFSSKTNHTLKGVFTNFLVSEKIRQKYFNSNSFLLSLALLVHINKVGDNEVDDLMYEWLGDKNGILMKYKSAIQKAYIRHLLHNKNFLTSDIEIPLDLYFENISNIIPTYNHFKKISGLRDTLEQTIYRSKKIKLSSSTSLDSILSLDKANLQKVFHLMGKYIYEKDFEELSFTVFDDRIVIVTDGSEEISNF
jgi:hypothetical protein